MVAKIEKALKALADKSRLRIVNMLVEKPMCVCEITGVMNLSQSTVSGHLRVLKDAGLVEDQKDGLWVEYQLASDNDFISGALGLILDTLEADANMREERNAARKTDRNLICKK
jgi:DNA-binding transcriptional ArsR family regulator